MYCHAKPLRWPLLNKSTCLTASPQNLFEVSINALCDKLDESGSFNFRSKRNANFMRNFSVLNTSFSSYFLISNCINLVFRIKLSNSLSESMCLSQSEWDLIMLCYVRTCSVSCSFVNIIFVHKFSLEREIKPRQMTPKYKQPQRSFTALFKAEGKTTKKK